MKAIKGIVNGTVLGAIAEGVEENVAITGAVQQSPYSTLNELNILLVVN